MKRPTEKQKQWLWFIGLWCCSLGAVLLLGYVIRLMMNVSG
jgi:hypothetical protein